MLPRIIVFEGVGALHELPFTRDQFFQVFADYNGAVWPAAIVAYAAAIAILALAGSPGTRARRAAAAILAGMWAWVGLVYHGLFFSQINGAAYVFAGAFLIQGGLLARHVVRGTGLGFRRASRRRLFIGWSMVAYATLAYPVIGVLAGETWPAVPLFGVTPCPLLIFTFGVMLMAENIRWWLWVIPMSWALIGGSAALLLAVPQDWALLLSGLIVLAFLVRGRDAATADGG